MLDPLVLASRLLLGAVFVVAAVAKLTDREGTPEAVEAFGGHWQEPSSDGRGPRPR